MLCSGIADEPGHGGGAEAQEAIRYIPTPPQGPDQISAFLLANLP